MDIPGAGVLVRPVPPKEYKAPWAAVPPAKPAKKAAKKAAKRARRGAKLVLEVKPTKGGRKPKVPKEKPAVPAVKGSAKEEAGLERLLAQARAIVPGITAEQMADALGIEAVRRQQLVHFALELVKDFEPLSALVRTGYVVLGGSPASMKLARREAKDRYFNPYVQLLVREWLETVKDEALFTTTQLIARLWAEANDFINGNSFSRITALKELARIRRIGGPQLNTPTGPTVNVMVVPLAGAPGAADAVQSWGAIAAGSQRNLTSQAS